MPTSLFSHKQIPSFLCVRMSSKLIAVQHVPSLFDIVIVDYIVSLFFTEHIFTEYLLSTPDTDLVAGNIAEYKTDTNSCPYRVLGDYILVTPR